MEITAVNNGPDHSLGARAVLATGQSCGFSGVFQYRGSLRAGQPATRTCVIPNVDLTDAKLAGTEPIGSIENHVDYTVCIDPTDASNIDDATESDCTTAGGQWHVGNVYDYDDSNNDIYLSQDPVSALNLRRARARAVPILVVRWTRPEDLFGSSVS